MSIVIAFAWRNGRIEFAQQTPEGALPLARGEDHKVRAVIGAEARHAYDGETLLVPGVHEEAPDATALDALFAFQDRVRECMARRSA